MVEPSERAVTAERRPIRCVRALVIYAAPPPPKRIGPRLPPPHERRLRLEGASDGRVFLPSCCGQNPRKFDDWCTTAKDHLLTRVSPIELRLSTQHPPRKAHRPARKRRLQSVQIG